MTLSATYSEENDTILSGLDIPEIYPGLYIPGVSNDGFIKPQFTNLVTRVIQQITEAYVFLVALENCSVLF